MKMLKKTLFIAVALLAFTGVQAQQKGDNAVGAGLVIGTGDLDNVGIGLKYQYNITAPIRIEPAFTYFFKKDFVSAWDIMANIQYILPVADQLNIYPLAGIGIQGWKGHASDLHSGFNDVSNTSFQFNIGCGAEYWFDYNWAGFFEFKYKLADADFANFVFGVAYKF